LGGQGGRFAAFASAHVGRETGQGNQQLVARRMLGDQWIFPLIKNRAQRRKNEIAGVIFQNAIADLMKHSVS
jgi:hypothetical protein